MELSLLKEKPFYLKDSDIDWVKNTLASMTVDEKIGQLFCPIGYSPDEHYLQHCILDKNAGGILFRDAPSEVMHKTYSYLQKNSKIPLLLAANLEAGGNGLLTDGTFYGKEMQVAASNDIQCAYELGDISCGEGAAVGCNFAFAPVVDIDLNFHNPITNVRTFGNDIDKIIAYSKEYIRAARMHNVMTSIKHFPGDGVDERDQHILTSVNSLSCEEWDRTYGRIYKELIDYGTKAVMVGHIALPSYQKKINPDFPKKIIPATLSRELLKNLLREKLNFNGLIISDATPMVGFCSAMERETAVPLCIEAGCDMFLFNKDFEEDLVYMKRGLEKGLLTSERLDEAVTRILAAKASLNLHTKHNIDEFIPPFSSVEKIVGCEEYKSKAKRCAEKSVTLVKDTQALLPISPKKHKRVLLELLGDCKSNARVKEKVASCLESKGFAVTVYSPEGFNADGSFAVDNVETFKSKYDLVLYIGNIENASNKTTNRINWHTFFGLGNNIPWFVEEVPTVFVSLANPYHLLDVPMVKTYINAYSNSDCVIETVVEKLLGKSSFTGVNPIDPFCGREELSY